MSNTLGGGGLGGTSPGEGIVRGREGLAQGIVGGGGGGGRGGASPGKGLVQRRGVASLWKGAGEGNT